MATEYASVTLVLSELSRNKLHDDWPLRQLTLTLRRFFFYFSQLRSSQCKYCGIFLCCQYMGFYTTGKRRRIKLQSFQVSSSLLKRKYAQSQSTNKRVLFLLHRRVNFGKTIRSFARPSSKSAHISFSFCALIKRTTAGTHSESGE